MTRKKIFIISIALLLFLLSGLVLWRRYRPAGKVAQNPAPGQEKAPAAADRSKEPACDKNLASSSRLYCIENIDTILNASSSKSCDEIKNEAARADCRTGYVIKEAAREGNLKGCESLTGASAQNSCEDQALFSMAISRGDSSFCGNINNQDDKNTCLAVVKKVPKKTIDSDQDGLLDVEERFYNTDPKNPDSDGDGLLDGEEVYKYRTDPNNKDSDGDGFSDGAEVRRGFDPAGPGKLKLP